MNSIKIMTFSFSFFILKFSIFINNVVQYPSLTIVLSLMFWFVLKKNCIKVGVDAILICIFVSTYIDTYFFSLRKLNELLLHKVLIIIIAAIKCRNICFLFKYKTQLLSSIQCESFQFQSEIISSTPKPIKYSETGILYMI